MILDRFMILDYYLKTIDSHCKSIDKKEVLLAKFLFFIHKTRIHSEWNFEWNSEKTKRWFDPFGDPAFRITISYDRPHTIEDVNGNGWRIFFSETRMFFEGDWTLFEPQANLLLLIDT